jgi:hypothetical protein
MGRTAAISGPLNTPARFAVERAVVKRDLAGPVRARVEQGGEPCLGLRARVGEEQRAAARFERGENLGQQAQSKMAGPGETLDRRRDDRVDLDGLRFQTLNEPCPRRRGDRQSGRHGEVSFNVPFS